MANYNQLKSSIQSVIKTNGNNEITGALMQQTLLSMINSLGAGYQYIGIAWPNDNPGTPDQRVFYLASQEGVYVNFGSQEISIGELGIFYYDGSWRLKKLKLNGAVSFDNNILKFDNKEIGTILGLNSSKDLFYKKVDADNSVNLFNIDNQNFIKGKYISYTGFQNNENFYISYPIKVYKGIKYKLTHFSSLGTNSSAAKCDENGTYIKSFLLNREGNFDSFTADEDAFVLFNIGYNDERFNFMLCLYDEYPNSFVGYKKKISDEYELGAGQIDQIKELYPLEIVKSVNLFNKKDANIKYGYYSNNKFNPVESYMVTAPIPVIRGVTYKATHATDELGVNINIAIVDESNNLIRTITGSVADKTITFTAPYDAFVSFNVGYVAKANTMMVCEESKYPEKYVPYYIELQDVFVKSRTVLYGKSVIFTGDSICAGANDDEGKKGWASRIGEKNNMVWQNKARGGATIMNNALIGSSFTICDTDFGDGADYIILEGGTNDADRIGSILNGEKPQYYGEWGLTDYKSDFANSTYCSAFERMIKRVVTSFPTAKVGYIVAPKMGLATQGYDKEHNNRRAYFETAIQICKKWGVPVLNLWDECTMNPMVSSHYSGTSPDLNGLYYDSQHPTAKGYEVLSPIIESWMETL